MSFASKTLNKNYAGEPLGLLPFRRTVKLLEKRADQTHVKVLIEFVLSKLEGTASEVVPEDPQTIDEILDALATEIKPESSKVVSSRILSLKFNKSSPQEFAKQAEELATSLQRAYIVEKIPRENAKEMTIDKVKELCRSNTTSDLVKSVIASTPYSDPKEVIAS